MYRNYDGKKSTFGDTSVSAAVPNPDDLSAFAAVRSAGGALTVMVINKYLSGATPATIHFASFTNAGMAQAWQLTSSNAITRLADSSFAGSSLSASLPPQSITLFVIPRSSAPLFRRGDSNADGKMDIADVRFTLTYIFVDATKAPGCIDAADANDDGDVDIADAIYSLIALFVGGPGLPAPFPGCGVDLTADSLTCANGACP